MGSYTPPAGPPQGALPSPEIYTVMGQEHFLHMMEDFYRELHQSAIADMFSPDPIEAAHRSGAFFIQMLGGPADYSERYGPPRMRARHMPFRIDRPGRDTWLACFKSVLKDAPAKYQFPEQHLAGFIAWLEEFSLWMINTD